jgi:rubrerythrin
MNTKKRLLIALYALYITFILISCASYIGEQTMRGKVNDNQYFYRLTFEVDGEQEHYTVGRTDITENGYITVKYTVSSNTVEVRTINVKTLEIDCRSIAEEKSDEILGQDYNEDTNAYKKYFIDKEVLHVKVDADHSIQLTLKDVPYPQKVLVDQADFTSYNFNDGVVVTTVPMDYSEVDVYFTSDAPDAPSAFIEVPRKVLEVDEVVTWNATGSTDPDGTIEDHIWDFGDGTYGQGAMLDHGFATPNIYRVYLTVRDNDGLIDTSSRVITVIEEGKDTDRDGMPDAWEDKFGIANPHEDPDEDDLSNLEEYRNQTFPTNPDTDDDDMPDGWEVQYGLQPTLNDANSDLDDDTFNNLEEFEAGTNPNNRNSHPPIAQEDEDLSDLLLYGRMVIIIIVIIILAAIRKIRKKEVAPAEVAPLDTKSEKAEKDIRSELKRSSGKQLPPMPKPLPKCPGCGVMISDKDNKCPKCGYNLAQFRQVKERLGKDDIPMTSHKVIPRTVASTKVIPRKIKLK